MAVTLLPGQRVWVLREPGRRFVWGIERVQHVFLSVQPLPERCFVPVYEPAVGVAGQDAVLDCVALKQVDLESGSSTRTASLSVPVLVSDFAGLRWVNSLFEGRCRIYAGSHRVCHSSPSNRQVGQELRMPSLT